MAKIEIYSNGPCEDPETYEALDVAVFIYEFYKSNPIPANLRIYKNSIAKENDITNLLRNGDMGELEKYDYYVLSEMPAAGVIIQVVIAIAISVVASVIFKPSIETPGSQNATQSSNNALGARENKPRVGKRLPDIRGRVPKAVPDLWSNYRVFVDHDEFDVSYLCLTTGLGIPDTIGNGATSFETVQGGKLAVYGPNTSPLDGSPFLTIGEPITNGLYVVREQSSVVGQSILPPNLNELTGNATLIASTDGVHGKIDYQGGSTIDFDIGDEFSLSGYFGFIYLRDEGGTDVYERWNLDTPTRYVVTDVTGSIITFVIPDEGVIRATWSNLDPTPQTVRSQAYYNPVLPTEWAWSNPGGWTFVTWSEPRIIPYSEAKLIGPLDVLADTEELLFNFVAPQGIYKKSNSTIYFDIDLEIQLSSDNLATIVAFTNIGSNKEEQAAESFRLTVPDNLVNPKVTVNRITNRDYSFNGSVMDDVKWRDLYMLKAPPTNTFGDVTTAFTETRSTVSALKLSALELNMGVTRADNGIGSESDEFADVIVSIHNDQEAFGVRSPSSLDVDTLYAVQEEIVDYFGSRDFIKVGYTFDSLKTRYEEAIATICDAVSVTAIPIGNKVSFFFERPQSVSALQFGHRSKNLDRLDDEVVTRSLRPENDYDHVKIIYTDRFTRTQETINVPSLGVNGKTIELTACVDPRAASVRAWREWNKLLYTRVQHVFTATEIARLAARGMRVDVVDNTDFNGEGGYVDSVDGLVVTLSEPVTIEETDLASLVVTKDDGSLQSVPALPFGDTGFQVVISEPFEEAPYTGWEKDKSEYTLYKDDERASLAMIVSDIEFGEIDDNQVTAINYSDKYYERDLDF